MRKSSKCSYKIGVNEKKKEKFLRPEQAVALADFLNSKPNIIKKYVSYKCTTCQFFHVGRSWEDKKMDTDIFNNQSKQTVDEHVGLKVVGHIDTYVKPAEVEVIEVKAVEQVEIKLVDDFDWDSNKRIIKWKK